MQDRRRSDGGAAIRAASTGEAKVNSWCRTTPVSRSRAGAPHASVLLLHSELLVDELHREGLVPVQIGGIHALHRHLLEEFGPARLGHGADAARFRVAAVDDAVFLDLVAAEGEELVGLLGI